MSRSRVASKRSALGTCSAVRATLRNSPSSLRSRLRQSSATAPQAAALLGASKGEAKGISTPRACVHPDADLGILDCGEDCLSERSERKQKKVSRRKAKRKPSNFKMDSRPRGNDGAEDVCQCSRMPSFNAKSGFPLSRK